MPMKPDIVILDEAAEIMPAPPTTEIKPWVPWEELDLKKIIQADRRYDLFGTETDEDQDVPDLQKLLQSLWQWQWPQQYYVFWEEKTKQPIFWKEREWMYDWVVVTDVKTIGKNVVQYSINWISQYWVMDKSDKDLPLIYIIPSEQQADPDQLEQQDPQQADPDDSENNQEQSEDQQEHNDGESDQANGDTETSDTQSQPESAEDEQPQTDETTSSTKPESDETESQPPENPEKESEWKVWWDENEDGEEWAEKIVKAGAKKVTPEELLTLPKQEFVLAKWNSTIINDDGTETPNASYHTVKIFDNTQSTSTTTWLYVHEGKVKYFYSNEDGRVWQKKHSTYDKDWCLYWIAKASW